MSKLKHKLPNNSTTAKYLESLPTIYLVGVWARAGVRPYRFTRVFDAKTCSPLVYDYDDKNGTEDAWFLRPLDYVTTGTILGWCSDEEEAKCWASEYNRKHSLT